MATTVSPIPSFVDNLPVASQVFSPVGPARGLVVESEGTRVYAVPGRYAVSYLIEGKDALVLVDVSSMTDLERIEAVVRHTDKPVKLVVPTHTHFDHVLGVSAAAERFQCPVALGPTGWQYMQGKRALKAPIPKLIGRFLFADWVRQGLPSIASEDVEMFFRINWPGKATRPVYMEGPTLANGQALPCVSGWTVIIGGGHSEEDVCLYHRYARLLIAGDMVTNFLGGEWNGLVTDPAAYDATAGRLRHLPVDVLCPAHGPLLWGERLLHDLRPAAPAPLEITRPIGWRELLGVQPLSAVRHRLQELRRQGTAARPRVAVGASGARAAESGRPLAKGLVRRMGLSSLRRPRPRKPLTDA